LEDTVKSKDPLTDPDQLSKIEEQFQQQNAIIGNLQKENQDLQNMMAQKENENFDWRKLVEEYQKRINRLRPAAKDNKKLRRLNKEKKTELQKIRQELLLLRSKTSPEVKNKVDEMMRKQDDLAGKVGNNKAKISTLKKDKNKLQEQKKELLEKIEELENERDQFSHEIEEEINLKKKFEELYSEEREKNLALRQHLDELTKEGKKPIPRNQSSRPKSASKYGRKNDSGEPTKNQDEDDIDQFGSDAGEEEKEILLNKINFNDIKAIAVGLRDKLKSKNVSFNHIERELPNEPLTLSEFKDLLSQKYRLEETDALMAARYIFEEDDIDSDNKVMFDELKQLETEIIVERLQKFIRLNNTTDAYKLSEESQNEINESIPQESLPRESIEIEKGIEEQALAKEQIDDEIEEKYSDIVDDFQVDAQEVNAQEHKPNKDSPKIEEEPAKPTAQPESSPEQEKESEIGEDEGLDIAEKCFSKMAEMMKEKNTTTINHFRNYISSQVVMTDEGQEFEVVFIPPMEFLEGVQTLGLNLSEQEIKCLMIILVKPELDNVILVQDLCMVMENFGIEENMDESEGGSERKRPNQDEPEEPEGSNDNIF